MSTWFGFQSSNLSGMRHIYHMQIRPLKMSLFHLSFHFIDSSLFIRSIHFYSFFSSREEQTSFLTLNIFVYFHSFKEKFNFFLISWIVRLARSCWRMWPRSVLALHLSTRNACRRIRSRHNQVLSIRWLSTLFLMQQRSSTFARMRSWCRLRWIIESLWGRSKCHRLRAFGHSRRRRRKATDLLENIEN